MDPGGGLHGVIYIFEFTKLMRDDASAEEIAAVHEREWVKLSICPYNSEPVEDGDVVQDASTIYDYADDYCFQIRGFGQKAEYVIWPQNNTIDDRPPLREKTNWLNHLKEACEHMQRDRNAAEGRTEPYAAVEFPKKFKNYPLEQKGKGLIDRQFAEFEGTIIDAVYGSKQSGSLLRRGGYDYRLLELLVCGSGEEKCSILRYRVRSESSFFFCFFFRSLPFFFP